MNINKFIDDFISYINNSENFKLDITASKHALYNIILLKYNTNDRLACLEVTFDKTIDDGSFVLASVSFNKKFVKTYNGISLCLRSIDVNDNSFHEYIIDTILSMAMEKHFKYYLNSYVPPEYVVDKNDMVVSDIELDIGLINKNIIKDIIKPIVKQNNYIKSVRCVSEIIGDDKIIRINMYLSQYICSKKEINAGYLLFDLKALSDNDLPFLNCIKLQDSNLLHHFMKELYESYNVYENFLYSYKNFLYNKNIISYI